MRYTVYTITTIDEDKVVYVGKTNDFQRRKREHLCLNSNAKDWIAVIGTDNVLIEPVTEFDTEEDALKCEDALILKYDTINRGYNKYRSGLIKAEDHKEYDRERKKTDKYREWQRGYYNTDKWREYHRDRYHAKKLGMSVAEYRQYIGE